MHMNGRKVYASGGGYRWSRVLGTESFLKNPCYSIMGGIDLKDKKILYHLDENARYSLAQIGRNVGLSKNGVRYRMENLEESGVIKHYYAVVDVYKLGYIVIKCHYAFQFTNPGVEKDIIQFFVENPHTVVVASARGTYDLAVILLVKDIREFYGLFLETQEKFGYYFKEKTLAFFIHEKRYRPSFLLQDTGEPPDRAVTMTTGGGERQNVDDLDHELLRTISNNARIPLTEIADAFDRSSSFVKYRLKNLMKSGVIRGFRIDLDVKKLGYQVFRVHLYLKQYNLRSDIIQYVEQNPHLVFIDTYAGDADLDLQFYFEDMDHFYEAMQDVMEAFPEAISFYKYYSIMRYHKFLYFPDR